MEVAQAARKAANTLKMATNDQRTAALKAIHDRLRDDKDKILEANRLDLEIAESADLNTPLIKRLDLTRPGKFDAMLQGVLDVAALDDPVGHLTLSRHIDDDLDLYRVTCPVGVLLVIFEARPEVIANIGALAIKSGNAAILKGGKESENTFRVMTELLQQALARTAIPHSALQMISSREQVAELLRLDEYIDMVIPRGSKELVRNIKRATSIPVLGHADGLCSMYIDSEANPDMAGPIAVDSKTDYPAACNAIETVLIHSAAVEKCLVHVVSALLDAKVKVKAESNLYNFLLEKLPGETDIVEATPEDFNTEFLSLTIAIREVSSWQAAVDHINDHGSHHTDCIVTENEKTASKFIKAVDSAGVYWNASTRFADGFRYGFGAEVGISTNKLHARGPVGLDGLTSYQYVLKGKGQVVSTYLGSGGSRAYKHEDFEA